MDGNTSTDPAIAQENNTEDCDSTWWNIPLDYNMMVICTILVSTLCCCMAMCCARRRRSGRMCRRACGQQPSAQTVPLGVVAQDGRVLAYAVLVDEVDQAAPLRMV